MKNRNVERLNHFTRETAESNFLDCCGSHAWAQKMTEARPFAGAAELLQKAEQIWNELDAADWLEAFAAHPKIGAKKAAPLQQARSATWSKGEQSGTNAATETALDALAEANRLYEEKFGFIFIVCATGKSADEMLEICRGRLDNDAEAEIRIAADEQRKITEIRLRKLVDGV